MTARIEMQSSESEAPLIGDMVKARREVMVEIDGRGVQ